MEKNCASFLTPKSSCPYEWCCQDQRYESTFVFSNSIHFFSRMDGYFFQWHCILKQLKKIPPNVEAAVHNSRKALLNTNIYNPRFVASRSSDFATQTNCCLGAVKLGSEYCDSSIRISPFPFYI